MAVKFLSEEWAAAVSDALMASQKMRTYSRGIDILIQMWLEGVPGGEASYSMHFKDGAGILLGAPPRSPDAEGRIEYADAISLWKGELDGPGAMMSGKLKVTGDMGKVMQAGNALGTLPEAIASLDVEY